MAAPVGSQELELAPPPPGFKSVNSQDGSIDYSNPSALRARLEARGIRLLVIRHGQSLSNEQSERLGVPLLYGQTESPLTALGMEQAHRCGATLYQELGGEAWARQCAADPQKLPVIISSSLERARQTSQALVDDLRTHGVELDYRTDDRLMETNFGRFEGRPYGELESAYPDFVRSWRPSGGNGTNYAHRFPEGESRCDVMNRLMDMLSGVAEDYPGRTVVLVSHSECLIALRAVLGLAPVEEGKLRAETRGNANATPYWLLPSPSAPIR